MDASDRYSAEVNQAAGMVTVQVGCRIEEALLLLHDRAAVAGLPVADIATAVLNGSIRFSE